DERRRLVPAHVLEHHHAGEDDAAGIDLVEIRVLGGRAVRCLEDGHSVADVAARRDAKTADLRGGGIRHVIAVEVRRRDDRISFLNSDLMKLRSFSASGDPAFHSMPAYTSSVFSRNTTMSSLPGSFIGLPTPSK